MHETFEYITASVWDAILCTARGYTAPTYPQQKLWFWICMQVLLVLPLLFPKISYHEGFIPKLLQALNCPEVEPNLRKIHFKGAVIPAMKSPNTVTHLCSKSPKSTFENSLWTLVDKQMHTREWKQLHQYQRLLAEWNNSWMLTMRNAADFYLRRRNWRWMSTCGMDECQKRNWPEFPVIKDFT